VLRPGAAPRVGAGARRDRRAAGADASAPGRPARSGRIGAHRRAACARRRALAQIGGAEATMALERGAGSRRPGLAEACRRALARLAGEPAE
jgi:hypothetical protein